MNITMTRQRDPSQKIRQLLGCWEQSIGDGGLCACNNNPSFDYNIAARWVKAGMKISKQTSFCIIYRCHHPDRTAGAQKPLSGGRSNLPLIDIIPPSAVDIINNTEDKSDDGETWSLNARSFPMTKTLFQKFEQQLHKRIIRQQRCLEVVRNCALGLFANIKHSVVVDDHVASLGEYNHIVNPPTAGSLANRNHTSRRSAANQLLWGWNALAGQWFKDLHCGLFFLALWRVDR
jgi:hypothetical protein